MNHACKVTYGVVNLYNWLLIVLSPITGVQSNVNLMDDCHQKSSTSQLHFYKLDVLFQGSHDGVIVVTYVTL